MADADTPPPISFADPTVQRCPFPAYERLRAEAPVYRDPLTGNWILTRYADVRRALLNTRALSNVTGLGTPGDDAELNAIWDASGWRPMNTLNGTDPPQHRRFRALVETAFTPARIAALEPEIDRIVQQLVDGFGADGVEFIAAFAVQLPLFLIAGQLGVDPNDMDRFKHWSDLTIEHMDPTLSREREREVVTELTAMQRYLVERIERVRQEPRDDLLSRLVHAEAGGERLEIGELLNIIQQLLTAGNETTTLALGSGTRLLAERPVLADRLRANPSDIPAFVEETLRTLAPLQTLFRRVAQDIEIDGVAIAEGATIELRFGAANLDPATFANPDDLDLGRGNATAHLTFGAGIHHCIGSQLARAELRRSFAVLLHRLPGLRLAEGADSIALTELYISHGPTRLQIAYDALLPPEAAPAG